MISVEAAVITKGIYMIPDSDGETIEIVCNWCSKSFFNGCHTKHPDTNWLEEIIEHLVGEHDPELIEEAMKVALK